MGVAVWVIGGAGDMLGRAAVALGQGARNIGRHECPVWSFSRSAGGHGSQGGRKWAGGRNSPFAGDSRQG